MASIEEAHLVPVKERPGVYLCNLCGGREKEWDRIKGIRHVKVHYAHAVQHKGRQILFCKCDCIEDSHFHCFHCDHPFSRKQHLEKHISSKHSTDNEEVKKTVNSHVTCTVCNLALLRKKLKTHMIRKHSRIRQPSITQERYHDGVCIDKQEGICLVREHLKGVHFPIHVQKNVLATNQSLFCESKECEQLNSVASVSGMLSFECPHLQSVQFIRKVAEDVHLSAESLDALIAKKRVKDSTKHLCQSLQARAVAENKILVASWDPFQHESDRHIFLSVFTGEKKYVCKHERVVVTFDQIDFTLNCQCCKIKMSCLHKAIAKWYLYQTKPERFQSGIQENGPFASPPDDVVISPSNVKTDLDVSKMVNYLKEKKMLPYIIPKEYLLTTFPKNIRLEPLETSCHCCQVDLTCSVKAGDGQLITRNRIIRNIQLEPLETSCHFCQVDLTCSVKAGDGQLITRNGIIRNIKVFKKRCSQCCVEYWYNEITSGIFNYDNSIFFSLDLMMWLRNAVQEHTAISREITVLERQYNVFIPKDKTIKAFFKFDEYWYNEITSGIFNYDNSIFFSLNLMMWLTR